MRPGEGKRAGTRAARQEGCLSQHARRVRRHAKPEAGPSCEESELIDVISHFVSYILIRLRPGPGESERDQDANTLSLHHYRQYLILRPGPGSKPTCGESERDLGAVGSAPSPRPPSWACANAAMKAPSPETRAGVSLETAVAAAADGGPSSKRRLTRGRSDRP